VDFNEYQMGEDIELRDNVVGYIGRLSEEKGILNFVQAIPKVIGERNDVTFLIVGEGNLEATINAFVGAHALSSTVALTGWIPHSELPPYLTRLKLLVLPSYTEGLPNIILESMACGTPVLATSVGSIPDLIKDQETGFLMHDNTPTHLAQDVLKVLARTDLSQVSVSARAFVENEFRYETLASRWRDIICSASKK
jgi:glycosyltransferase involved in cell wall biosynthesis